ncbi:hypothetical protein Acr_18g0010970 [Actinidia rufa]|uniref:Uncharacterized protein n=1 Tax=Actinidia rufa TaxID=165716 RepID=A0A7J0G806_9ERIC|nr:hypothetical protein Acr_18g0010970 [Actinidia rufa]
MTWILMKISSFHIGEEQGLVSDVAPFVLGQCYGSGNGLPSDESDESTQYQEQERQLKVVDWSWQGVVSGRRYSHSSLSFVWPYREIAIWGVIHGYRRRNGEGISCRQFPYRGRIPLEVSSSDLEDLDELAFALPQPMVEEVIAQSFSKGGGSNMSSGEVNMAPRFRTLGQKKSKVVVDPPAVPEPPIDQDSPLPLNLILTLAAPIPMPRYGGKSSQLPSSTNRLPWLILPRNTIPAWPLHRPLESYNYLGPYKTTIKRIEKSKKKVSNLESKLKQAKLGLALPNN